jgi:WD40 repeat protein
MLQKWGSASGGMGTGDRITGAGMGIIHRDIAVLKNKQGKKTQVTAMGYSPDGGHLAATGIDGSLQIYRTSGSFNRPELVCWNAHQPGTETSSVKYSMDGDTIVTRGGDDTLKV